MFCAQKLQNGRGCSGNALYDTVVDDAVEPGLDARQQREVAAIQ